MSKINVNKVDLKNFVAYLIDEVCCLQRPSAWNIVPLNLYLLRQDVVSDFLSAFANVRSLK